MKYLKLGILLLLGILMVAKPDLLWKVEHVFSVKNGEPSDLYIILMQISGIVFIFVSIACAVFL